MRYRCLTCDHQEDRGVLPSASCGMYGCGLCCLSLGGLWLVAIGLRAAAGPKPEPVAPVEPVADPWWVGVLGVGLMLGFVVVGAVAIDLLLSWVEYLVVRRRPCPACGGRRWSAGYTIGFGL